MKSSRPDFSVQRAGDTISVAGTLTIATAPAVLAAASGELWTWLIKRRAPLRASEEAARAARIFCRVGIQRCSQRMHQRSEQPTSPRGVRWYERAQEQLRADRTSGAINAYLRAVSDADRSYALALLGWSLADQLYAALLQLAEEGAAQAFRMLLGHDWIVGAMK